MRIRENRACANLSTMLLGTLVILVVLCILALRTAVVNTPVRLLFLATILLAGLTLVAYLVRLFRHRPRVLEVLVVVVVILGLWVSLGARRPDTERLRSAYLGRLATFDGVRYVRGGETHSGIDAAGLARVAFLEAMLGRGLHEANPRLLGPNLWRLWWRDLSASDMLRGKYRHTVQIGRAEKLSRPDTIKLDRDRELLPGDLAVTDNGVHVLVYLGGGRWMEASPDDGRVAINEAEGSKRLHFNMPVTLMRWWLLE